MAGKFSKDKVLSARGAASAVAAEFAAPQQPEQEPEPETLPAAQPVPQERAVPEQAADAFSASVSRNPVGAPKKAEADRKDKPIIANVTPAVRSRVERASVAFGISYSEVVRRALDEFLDAHEAEVNSVLPQGWKPVGR